MKRTLLFTTAGIFLSLWLLLFQDCLLAFQNEPNGFRGIEWETPSDRIEGLSLIGRRQAGGGMMSYYERESDELVFGKTEVDQIRYVFFNGKFFLAHLKVTESRFKYKAIRKTLQDRYGQPAAAFPRKGLYSWEGEKVTITLKYDDFLGGSVIYYQYNPIVKMLEAGP